MPTIKTRICSQKIPGMDIARQRTEKAISTSGNKVSVGILRAGVQHCRIRVRTSLVSEAVAADADQLFACAGLDGFIEWYRDVETTSAGDFIRRDTGITLAYDHPKKPCRWKMTRILGQRQLVKGKTVYKSTKPSLAGGPLPQDGGVWYPEFEDFRGDWPQCEFVPGENILLEWVMTYGSAVVAGTWFNTPAFTGGEVEGIVSQGENKRLNMRVHGASQMCMPTDFAEYVLADWVYLLKQDSPEATATDRKNRYGSSDTLIDAGATNNDASGPTGVAGEILLLVNQERSKEGLKPLKPDMFLTRSATEHSRDMAKHKTTSHTGTDGSSPDQRIQAAGYIPGTVTYGNGENVASGYYTAQAVMTAWMASHGHRANILRPEFTDIGISVDYDEDGVPYYTQNFGFGGATRTAAAELRAVPVRFNDYGADGDYEVLDYTLDDGSNFPDGFEVSQHIGVITELWPQNVTPLRDAAKIKITGLGKEFFDWVDIFYHCEDATTVGGGMAAFSVDDEVIVLNEGGKSYPNESDLVIVGFPDIIKPCKSGPFLLIELDGEYLIWDVARNAAYAITDANDATVEYPINATQLSYQLGKFVNLGIILIGALGADTGESTSPALLDLSVAETDLNANWEVVFETHHGCPTNNPFWDLWDWDKQSVTADGSGYRTLRMTCDDEVFGWYSMHSTENSKIDLTDTVDVPGDNVFEKTAQYLYAYTCNSKNAPDDPNDPIPHETSSRKTTRSYKTIKSPHFDIALPITTRKSAFIWMKQTDVQEYAYSGPGTDCTAYGDVTDTESFEILYTSYINPTLNQSLLTFDGVTPQTVDPCVKGGWYKEFAMVLEQPMARGGVSDAGGFAQISIQTNGVFNAVTSTYDYDWAQLHMIDMTPILSVFSKTIKEDILDRGALVAGLQVSIYAYE